MQRLYTPNTLSSVGPHPSITIAPSHMVHFSKRSYWYYDLNLNYLITVDEINFKNFLNQFQSDVSVKYLYACLSCLYMILVI